MDTPKAMRSCWLLISRAFKASLEKIMFLPLVTVTSRLALLYKCRRALGSFDVMNVNVMIQC